MRELLDQIRSDEIAAPCPIEQRWTAASTSPLSPAAATRCGLQSRSVGALCVCVCVQVAVSLGWRDASERWRLWRRFLAWTAASCSTSLLLIYTPCWVPDPPHPTSLPTPTPPQLCQRRGALLGRDHHVPPLRRWEAARRDNGGV